MRLPRTLNAAWLLASCIIIAAAAQNLQAASEGGGLTTVGVGGRPGGSSNGPGGGGGGSGSVSGGGGTVNGCSNVGDNLFRGSCSSFVNYFKGKADTAIGESDAQFATTVAAAPVPSDACCRDARQFTSSGCSCDATLMAQAARQGVGNNAIRIIARATQASRCTSSTFGGGIGTGGC